MPGDEALGCYLVKQLDEYREAEVVRSRDPKVLDPCDIVLDVGGTYEPGQLCKVTACLISPVCQAHVHYISCMTRTPV